MTHISDFSKNIRSGVIVFLAMNLFDVLQKFLKIQSIQIVKKMEMLSKLEW